MCSTYLVFHDAHEAIVEDTTMKTYRVVTFLAAALLAVFFSWALGHEHIGSQEEQAIEAAAP